MVVFVVVVVVVVFRCLLVGIGGELAFPGVKVHGLSNCQPGFRDLPAGLPASCH